tara:strand:+ start:238 stop:468 length:231 start_codon:yes stop_codon:yes gene_type:complete
LIAGSIFLSYFSEPRRTKLSKELVLIVFLDEKKARAPEVEVNLSKSKEGNAAGFFLSFRSNFIKETDPEIVYIDYF